MDLLLLIIREYRWRFTSVMLASLANAGLGVGLIAFINERLIAHQDATLSDLPGFLGLVIALLVVALTAQLGLTTLGHYFVFDLRSRLVKQILDTDIADQEKIGSAALMASLSADIRNISIAFVRLPELVQGTVLTLAGTAYLGWLSPPLLLVTTLCVAMTLLVGSVLVRRVYAHLGKVRAAEDALYQDYERVIHGRRELALNRERARHEFQHHYLQNARDYRHHIIRADTYHLSTNNWVNVMLLAVVGLVFFLVNVLGWANSSIATTYALTLLFLRSPMIGAVGALPTLLNAQVAFNKLAALNLAPYKPGFDTPHASDCWQCIQLKQVRFSYDNGYTVGPLDFTLTRGEIIFIIGANGSGKSTFAHLLSGLYAVDGGQIIVDGVAVPPNRTRLRQLFSSVFTDFHLFDQLLKSNGDPADEEFIARWCQHLQLEGRLSRTGAHLLDTKLSQGQRKRVALLTALAENRNILLLDEWAADQDPLFRQVFYRELIPVFRQLGYTLIAISHDDSYFSAADRLLEMRQGQLIELTPSERELAGRSAVARIGRAL